MLASLRKSVFGISLEETTFARRGFHVGDFHAHQHLELIGATFLRGYHAALEESKADALGAQLNAVASPLRSFAFEGAAMALTLLDHLMPWQIGVRGPRLQAFLEGPGADHVYMVHVGVGWALARLPWRTGWPPHWLDPLLGWLAVDGYGFHAGYFYWRRYVRAQAKPVHLFGYAGQVFDQGLGRSLWFVEGADVTKISHTIATFPSTRHADLWSGVGLACAYAGGVDESQIVTLHTAAGSHQPCLAQGAAFAAKARQRAGNPTDHTALACAILCGLSADAAAGVTDTALKDLPPDGSASRDGHPLGAAYALWRQRIRARFAEIARQA